MKKKHTRRVAESETKDTTSSCSDSEKMKLVTRSSARKKKISSSNPRNSSINRRMADSAYEADDSSRSDTSPPKQNPQPMDVHTDTPDDLAVAFNSRKRKNAPQITKAKKSNKVRSNLNMSTSTPVFEGAKLRDDSDCRLVTPEVTPILAADDDDVHNPKSKRDVVAHSQNQNLSTPTLRRSARKRSFSFHDPDLSAIVTELSFDSQADSGIVVSPPLKRTKSSRPTVVSYFSRQPISSKTAKEDVASKPVVKSKSVPSKKSEMSHPLVVLQRVENYSIKGKSVLKESGLNSSCFGFDSIQTPSPIVRGVKKSRNLQVKKATKPSQKAYRSPVPNSSDSPLEDSPGGVYSDFSSVNTDSQENILVAHPSPSLFSDDMFSDGGDPMCVNKVSNKSYRGVKPKIKISKPQVSKLDAWANSFNTELESIEKFDLNIE